MIVGHEDNLKQLKQWLNQGQLPQSLLVCGLKGIGKSLVVEELILQNFCQKISSSSLQNTPCHSCPSCLQIKSKQHPDVLWIAPQEKESDDGVVKTSAIKIEQIRQIQDVLQRYALGSKQFIVIENADEMTLQACNALLKSLEEPKKDCYFILTTSNSQRLLITIRSRCFKLVFKSLSASEIKSIFTQNGDFLETSEQEIERWIQMGGGSVDSVTKALQQQARIEPFWQILKTQDTIPFYKKVQIAGELAKNKEELPFIFMMLKAKLKHEFFANDSQADKSFYRDYLNRIDDAERSFERHLKPEFILETLLL